MKYFWDFVEYVIMRELGHNDSIVRNYLIECDYASGRIVPSTESMYVRLALKRMGLTGNTGLVNQEYGEVKAALAAKGYIPHDFALLAHLGAWYNYHRIKLGELQRWPKRANTGAPV